MLESAIALAVSAFEKLTIVHRNLTKAKDRLKFAIKFARQFAIIVLTGPTGVGKTTLLSQFVAEFLAEHADAMRDNPSLRPIAYTIAVASGHRNFDFKRLCRDGLRSLDDPFCKDRDTRNDGRQPTTILNGESAAVAVLREQLEIAFKSHGTKVWIIDEAQHCIRGANRGGPGGQFDILKSISQTAGVQLVLCGPHDLPDSISLSGQLSRRSEVIRLDRYRWGDKKEVGEFASAIASVMSQMPHGLAHPPVKGNLRYFYLQTMGCVGIFKDWISRAYQLVLQEGAESLTLRHFQETQLTPLQLATINNEIIQGELAFAGQEAAMDMQLVRAILGGGRRPKNSSTGKQGDVGETGAPAPVTPEKPKPQSPTGAPFERNATRDVVGEEA